MCSRFESPTAAELAAAFGVDMGDYAQQDIFPGYSAPFLRLASPEAAEEGVSFEAEMGVFGLLPPWAKDMKLARNTFNARSETIAEKPSFRSAWRRAQHCIIPARAIYEPDWRSGKAVATRICRADGELMGIAGLWERWKSPDAGTVHSFTMITINADEHSLMRNFHRPGQEKRMVVILPKGAYKEWLRATMEVSLDFLREYPADRMISLGHPE
ncbi:SOS response-associated peptidase [Pseudomonas sp. DP-17]|uniref:SOS response-associated peptidase n=1 Tax=Pseudomonas sp. DP-17 TaxID=1580486 RepID=UPI001EFACB16|nr:SOS response-associated peptidase [Pseudomonas sp. DP-17]MCG8911004.1 SOS response-associated peptidase [Pseudomonas sp. DP-17]